MTNVLGPTPEQLINGEGRFKLHLKLKSNFKWHPETLADIFEVGVEVWRGNKSTRPGLPAVEAIRRAA